MTHVSVALNHPCYLSNSRNVQCHYLFWPHDAGIEVHAALSISSFFFLLFFSNVTLSISGVKGHKIERISLGLVILLYRLQLELLKMN